MRSVVLCLATLSVAFGHHARCGIDEYNTDLALCCDNEIVHNPQNELRCCRNMGFKPGTQICHNGYIVAAIHGPAYLTGERHDEYGYGIDASHAVGNFRYGHSYYGSPYYPAHRAAFYQQTPVNYDTSRLHPYNDKPKPRRPKKVEVVEKKIHYQTCGAMKIGPGNFLCCGETYYSDPTRELACCGNRLMDGSIYECVSQELQPKYKPTQPAANMCGGVVPITNPAKELCCDGTYVQNQLGKLGCCSGHIYDRQHYGCGTGRLQLIDHPIVRVAIQPQTVTLDHDVHEYRQETYEHHNTPYAGYGRRTVAKQVAHHAVPIVAESPITSVYPVRQVVNVVPETVIAPYTVHDDTLDMARGRYEVNENRFFLGHQAYQPRNGHTTAGLRQHATATVYDARDGHGSNMQRIFDGPYDIVAAPHPRALQRPRPARKAGRKHH